MNRFSLSIPISILTVFVGCFVFSISDARADLKVRGFADLVGSLTDVDFTINPIGNRGYDLNTNGSSRLGVNLNADLDDHWDFAGQLVGRGYQGSVGGEPGYIVAADWLFLTYRPTDAWKIRAGRQIYPLFLYSEQIDVGFTYLWTRLPNVVYGLVPVKSFNGVLASYTQPFGNMQLSAAIFGGSGEYLTVSPGIGGSSIADLDVRGGYLTADGGTYKLSLSYKASRPLGTVYAASGSGTQLAIPLDIGFVQTFILGGKFHTVSWDFGSEFATVESGIGTLGGSGGYVSAAYGIADGLLTPYLTYGRQRTDGTLFNYPVSSVTVAKGTGAHQESFVQWIAGLDYHATSTVVLKMEYEQDDFTYRDSSLNFVADTYTVGLSTVF